jgi:hypothetical protein
MTDPCIVNPSFTYTRYPCDYDDPRYANTRGLPVVVDLQTPVKAEVVNRQREAILAIEGELGTSPSGIHTTVRDRLDSIEIMMGTPTPDSPDPGLVYSTHQNILGIDSVIANHRSDVVTVVGGRATALPDCSRLGTLPVTQGTLAQQPYVVTDYDGSPALKCGVGGVYSYMEYTAGVLAAMTEGEVFIVVRQLAPLASLQTGFGGLYNFGTNGVGSMLQAGSLYDEFGSTVRTAGILISDNGPFPLECLVTKTIIHVRAGAGLKEVRINGELVYQSAVNTFAMGATQGILAGANPVIYWRGLYFEDILTNKLLTERESKIIYAYLFERHSIRIGFPKRGYARVVAQDNMDDGTGQRLGTSDAELDSIRDNFNSIIWGTNGQPLSTVPTVTTSIISPITGLTNLLRCDGLSLAIPAHKTGGAAITVNPPAIHLLPTSNDSGKAVLWCCGHAGVLDDQASDPTGYRNHHVIKGFNDDGHHVFVYSMPGFTFGSDVGQVEPGWGGSDPPHQWLLGASNGLALENIPWSETEGHGLRLFLALPLAIVTYALSLGISKIVIAGISGGGQFAILCPALDKRISLALSVCGFVPGYFWGIKPSDVEDQLYLYQRMGFVEQACLAAQHRRAVVVPIDQDSSYTGSALYAAGAPRQPRSRNLSYANAWADFESEVASVVSYGSPPGTFIAPIDYTGLSHQTSIATEALLRMEVNNLDT